VIIDKIASDMTNPHFTLQLQIIFKHHKIKILFAMP